MCHRTFKARYPSFLPNKISAVPEELIDYFHSEQSMKYIL